MTVDDIVHTGYNYTDFVSDKQKLIGSSYYISDGSYRDGWRELNKMSHDDVMAKIDYDSIPDQDTFLEITQHIGNLKRAGSNNMYGLNHRGLKPAIQQNKDHYGLTFFTRPQLNLSSFNIRRNRRFFSLLTTNPNSVHRYVRMMLDPRLGHDYLNGWRQVVKNEKVLANANKKMSSMTCPLVDSHMGFIPILTNNLISLSGWPDLALNSYTSDQGLKGQQWIMVDSAYEFLEAYNLTATFRNTRDEPIILLFQTWERYMSQVFEGMMSPYMDMIVNNEMDYNTRIYRLVLDESKTFVKKISACGAAFPVNVPTGKFFDYSDEELYNRSTKEIDITFQCVGAEYNDPITIQEFNQVSAIFHSGVRRYTEDMYLAEKKGESTDILAGGMMEIPRGLLSVLNNRGYPVIDPSTMRLKWLIDTSSKDLAKILRYIKL